MNEPIDECKKPPTIEDLKMLRCPEGYKNRIEYNMKFCDELLSKSTDANTKVHVYYTVEKSKRLLREADIKFPDVYIPIPISENTLAVYKEVKENKNNNNN